VNTALKEKLALYINGFIIIERGRINMRKSKKGAAGQIGALVGGIIGLVFLVVIGFVSLNVLTDANLLTSDSEMDLVSDALITNLTTGVTAVGNKIPTMFTIAVAVLLLGLIVFLVMRARQTQQAQGGSI